MSDRREFLMLAKPFNIKKHGIGGWFMSEKLDGQRAFWDGGISRGMPKEQVPWANCAKDDRYVVAPIATGLWSRYGNVIHAPDWWLDSLPKVMLDGELWTERGQGTRQELSKIIKKNIPGPGWKKVKYFVFDIPSISMIFRDGRINDTNFKKIIKGIHIDTTPLDYHPMGPQSFIATYRKLLTLSGKHLTVLQQDRLPFQTSAALEVIDVALNRVTDNGGEGLMLRKPESWWLPKRSHHLLKIKKRDDAEGMITGFISGRRTDKGSKLLGLMGAMILSFDNKRLELSGFTDQERAFDGDAARIWAENHPGEEAPDWISCKYFQRGERITFRYRGLTRDGIPQEAHYWRRRAIDD